MDKPKKNIKNHMWTGKAASTVAFLIATTAVLKIFKKKPNIVSSDSQKRILNNINYGYKTIDWRREKIFNQDYGKEFVPVILKEVSFIFLCVFVFSNISFNVCNSIILVQITVSQNYLMPLCAHKFISM